MATATQIAFDSGAGHRAISHDRTNPYDQSAQPEQHAAWERGWETTDRAANAPFVDDPNPRPEFLG